MNELDDLAYGQRVASLLAIVHRAGERQARRALEQEQALLTDIRWWPTVLKRTASPSSRQSTLPWLEGMWFPAMTGMPTRRTITVADVGLLAASVREVLSRLPPLRLGPAGAINLLLALPDVETLAHEGHRLSPVMDDAFFDALLGLQVETEWLGLETFARQVEELRQRLLFLRIRDVLAELAAKAVHYRSDREAASLIVKQARTAPKWLHNGLEELIPRVRKQEIELPDAAVALALEKAALALAEGQDERTIIAHLEEWRPLGQFIRYQRLLRRPPFSIRSGEDWLARYGARAKAFLLQLGQAQGALTAALFRLALAESRAEEEAAIASEPRLLSATGEQEARLRAADAEQQGQRTLATRLSAAADRIATLLADLARPEQNPVARLAEQVDNGELSLDNALARLLRPDVRQRVGIPHIAALDEQATRLLRSGDLRRAEILATLNHAAAQGTGHAKIQADTAITLAGIKGELGQQQEAVRLFGEAARLAEPMDDPTRLILAVGPLGTAYRELGNDEGARRCYERALALARLAGDESLEVAALGNLADLYLQTGDTEAALSFSEQALTLARTLGDTCLIAQALGGRATALHRAGRLEEAVELYREALETLREIPDIGSETRNRLGLGQALAELGELKAAMAELEQAHQLAVNTGNRPLQAGALSAIGALHLRRGDAARGLEAMEQALAVENGLGPLEQAFCWLRMAAVQIDLDQLTFAEQAIERAEALAAALSNLRLEAAMALYRARLQAERGQWPESEAGARRALALAQRLQHPDLELAALDLLGRAYQAQGRLKEAEGCYTRVLEQARAGRRRAEAVGALLHLGILRAGQSRFAEAGRSLQAALEEAGALGLTSLQHYAHYHLGLLYTAADDLPRGLEHLKAAIALAEQQRAALSQVEAFERRYAAGREDVYRLAAETAFRLGRPLEALEMLEQGRARLLARRLFQWEALPPAVPEELRERFKRTLQAVQFLRNQVYGEPSWGARQIEEALRGLEVLGKARSKEAFERLLAEARAQEQQQMRHTLAEAEAELDAIAGEIRAYAPGFSLQLDLPPLAWDEIAGDPTTAVVALFVGRQVGAAVLLHPSGMRVVDLPGLRRGEVDRLLYGLPAPLAQAGAELQKQIAQASEQAASTAVDAHRLILRWMIERPVSFRLGWQVALRTLISGEAQGVEEECIWPFMWQHLFDDMAGELRARLWQPLLPILREAGVARVVLMPDADLHALPLALGLADEPDAPAVAMAPSLRLYAQCLRRLREREPREDTLLLIANPTGDLLAADMEAVLLRDLFAAHGQATFTLTGDQATRQNVIRTARVGNYWHFAGHARYEWWDPTRSALRLAKGDKLPLFWVPIWLDLRATRLAVLSACETAMTPARDPAQEFEGLFTAFLAAGAPAVLASLWPVEELSTALLIHRFYQYHLGDPREDIIPHSPAEAFRDAQQWLRTLTVEEEREHLLEVAVRRRIPRKRPIWLYLLALEDEMERGVKYPHASPYFWAGFVFVGA